MIAYNSGYQPSGGKGGASTQQPQVYNTAPGVTGGGTPGKGGLGNSPGMTPTSDAIGSTLPPTAQPAVLQEAPTANTMGPNAFETGLNAQNNSMDWMRNAMNYQAPQLGGYYGAQGSGYQAQMANAPGQDLYNYDPSLGTAQSYNAAQLSDQDINQYMNPYTQNVIDSTMGDLDRARQNALNNTGAAASRGGAFGGDRHGIMEAQNNNDYMQNVARTSSQLRNQGFQNAQNAAMGDVASQNQARSSNAQMAQQTDLTNAAAQNARDRFLAQTANSNYMTTEMANAAAQNAAGAVNAQLAQANNQFNAGQNMRQDQFNANQMNQAFNNQMSAAQGLYGMGQDRWNMGQNALNQMSDVGGQIDDLNQNLINQQIQMFMNQQGAPQAQFQNMLGPLSALSGGGTQSYNPGKMDYLGMGTQLGAAALMKSDAGLKDDLTPVAKINGFQLYKWKWNEKAREIGCDHEPTIGVVAQEVREIRPEAILEDADGYLMVDYGKLPELSRTVEMMRA